MIVPNNDESDAEDTKVKFWETLSIANSVKIEVSKNQTYSPVDYYEKALLKTAPKDHVVTSIDENYEFYEYKYYYADDSTSFVDGMTATTSDVNHSVVKLNCSNVSKYRFTFNENDSNEHIVDVAFCDATGVRVDIIRYTGESGESVDVLVPEGAAYVCFNVLMEEKPIVINVLKPR